MHDSGIQLLKLMFKEGETICVSPNKYGYHSVPLESAISDKVTLVSPNPDVPIETVDSDKITLVALNPIHGFREDLNCTSLRNFMVELDYGPLTQQMGYINTIGMPYSACIFSGNKSLHFLISLDTDLQKYEHWRVLAEWILNIATLADQATKNPSRSIRLPGAFREPGKQQKMVDFKGKVTMDELVKWLGKFPGAKPLIREKREISTNADMSKVKGWVIKALKDGLDPAKGRNKQWFAIACEFALAGYSEDDTLDILSGFFQPERDFKEREWKTAILSGFKYVYERK